MTIVSHPPFAILNVHAVVKVLSDQHYDMLRPARSVSDEDVINEMTCMTERPATKHYEIFVSPPQDEPHPSDSRNNCPRPLRDINPAATFVSETKVECWSLFNVFQNDIFVATETTKPECQPVPSDAASFGNARYIYSTTLVPNFWPKLCSCSGWSLLQTLFVVLDIDRHVV